MSPRPVHILCLDGGGFRGLASLLMLQKFWDDEYGKNSAFRPGQKFDFICGTSTGGIITLLLGRLGATVDQAIELYLQLGKEIFGNPQAAWHWAVSGKGRIDAGKLEQAVRKVVGDRLLIDEDLGHGHRSYTAVTTVLNGTVHAEPIWLRAYPSSLVSLGNAAHTTPPTGDHVWSIIEAVRATSAAPTYFDPVTVNGRVFEDAGAAGFNNVCSMALVEVSRIPDLHERPLGCIVSVGTGMATNLQALAAQIERLPVAQGAGVSKLNIMNVFGSPAGVIGGFIGGLYGKGAEILGRTDKLMQYLANIASNTEQEHARMFARFHYWDHPTKPQYWRLNIPTIGDFDLADVGKEPAMRAAVEDWWKGEMTRKALAVLAEQLEY